MTLIVIIVDGKWHSSFNGDLKEWIHEQFFTVINPKLQTSTTELPCPIDPPRVKKLKIVGNVHSDLDMTLALFCYDMVNPTRRMIEYDMQHYEVEQYRNRTRH